VGKTTEALAKTVCCSPLENENVNTLVFALSKKTAHISLAGVFSAQGIFF